MIFLKISHAFLISTVNVNACTATTVFHTIFWGGEMLYRNDVILTRIILVQQWQCRATVRCLVCSLSYAAPAPPCPVTPPTGSTLRQARTSESMKKILAQPDQKPPRFHCKEHLIDEFAIGMFLSLLICNENAFIILALSSVMR